MSSLVIFDTSIFIDQLRSGRHDQQISSMRGLIRNSSVVLSELWRSATTRQEKEFLRWLERNRPIFSPTERNWLDSGLLLSEISTDTGFAWNKLRDLHFDVLIALTARSNGARLITSNRADFELIQQYRSFDSEIW